MHVWMCVISAQECANMFIMKAEGPGLHPPGLLCDVPPLVLMPGSPQREAGLVWAPSGCQALFGE